MQELRFVAVSEDGRYAVLAVPGRSARFTLPIDERLRAVALGQTSRLVQYEIEVESPLRPKEIQARIRAGETVEEIADAAGIAVERVRWFEGPVLAERAYVADQAQAASIRRQGDATPSTPGQRLGEIVAERLKVFGSDPEDALWDAKKRGDGNWQVQLIFMSGDRRHVAEWVFDPRRRHVLPADDNAARISLPGGEPPQPVAPPPGEATVTQLAPRLSAASGQGFAPSGNAAGFGPAGVGNGVPGNGTVGNGSPGSDGPGGSGPGGSGPGGSGPGNGGPGNGGRARHERPGSGRPAVSEPAASAPSAPSSPFAPSSPSPSAAPSEPVAPLTVSAASSPDPGGDVPRAPAPGRHSLPQATPQKTSETAFVRTRSERDDNSSAPEVSQPGQKTQEPRAPQARPEAAVPAARSEARAEETAAPAATPAPPAEPASEQTGRQARKTARGKRSSVPSWDEIMFGNNRQRD
jgi:Protein of unknown function (DUF3071)